MLIWGWKTYVTRLAVLFAVCASCRHEGAQVVDKRQTKFTLFFIPLFPTSTKYLQQCTLCAAQTRISKEAADAAVAQAASGVPRGGGAAQPAGGSRGQDALVPLVVSPEELRDGTVRQIQVETGVRCEACGGRGGAGSTPCTTCSGGGRVRAHRTISAPVPAGSSYGTRVRLEGEGEVGAQGGPVADIYVELVAPVASSPR